jgi:glycosyltransferase involved in cell wall biosynthesis
MTSAKKRPVIGLNGRFLVAQRTGVQRSAYRLFESILDNGHDLDFVLFTGESERFAPEWQRPNVKIVTSPLQQTSLFKNHVWEQVVLPRLALQHHVDILHSPANLAPLFFPGKSVVNIHDLCFLVQPAWFSWSFRLIYSWLVPAIARRASRIITNSNYSKNDIMEFLHVETGRLNLTYWAVDPLFFQYAIPRSERKERILFVGSLEPRKNLKGLLEAFNLYRARNRKSQLKLTIVGCESRLFAAERYNLGEFASDIDFVGYISDNDLAKLYGNALALVYPSYYEGFGFPPLEAMAASTPVITSRNSSLPEVVGEAAILVDPASPPEIAMAIEDVLKPERALKLVELGNVQVRKFRWNDVGEHVVEIYKELLTTSEEKRFDS